MDWLDPEITITAKAARQLGMVTETSLSRVYHHFLRRGKHPFAIFTAWRGLDPSGARKPKKANKAAMKELAKDLKSLGHAHIRVKGVGQEGGRTVVEPSYLVVGIPRHHAIALGKKYHQDWVVHSGPHHGRRRPIELVNTKTGKADATWNHFFGRHPHPSEEPYRTGIGGSKAFFFGKRKRHKKNGEHYESLVEWWLGDLDYLEAYPFQDDSFSGRLGLAALERRHPGSYPRWHQWDLGD